VNDINKPIILIFLLVLWFGLNILFREKEEIVDHGKEIVEQTKLLKIMRKYQIQHKWEKYLINGTPFMICSYSGFKCGSEDEVVPLSILKKSEKMR